MPSTYEPRRSAGTPGEGQGPDCGPPQRPLGAGKFAATEDKVSTSGTSGLFVGGVVEGH